MPARERCACHPSGSQVHLQQSYAARGGGDRRHFARAQVAGLVDGTVYTFRRDLTGRGVWDVEDVSDDDPLAELANQWAGLRSRLEHHGQLESEGAATLMDLERGLQLLARRHPDAATVIATRVMNALDDEEMDVALPYGRERTNWRRLRNKGVAFLAAYLNGQTLEGCEKAFKGAL